MGGNANSGCSSCGTSANDYKIIKIYGDEFYSDTRAIISILNYCRIPFKHEKQLIMKKKDGHFNDQIQSLILSHENNRISSLSDCIKYLKLKFGKTNEAFVDLFVTGEEDTGYGASERISQNNFDKLFDWNLNVFKP